MVNPKSKCWSLEKETKKKEEQVTSFVDPKKEEKRNFSRLKRFVDHDLDL